MDRFAEIKSNIIKLAESCEEIKAVIEIGSQIRSIEMADEYSDLDLVILSTDENAFFYDDKLLSEIGNIKISFIEPTFGGGRERRILFEGSLDVDFVVLSPEQFEELVSSRFIDGIFARGFRVVYDSIGIAEKLSEIKTGKADYAMPTQDEFCNIVNDFWFHSVWLAKKICRGELWTAKMCIDGYMKTHLMKITELNHLCRYGKDFDVWHNGRMFEKWADREVAEKLGACFAGYDKAEIISALKCTAELFGEIARGCTAYTYPQSAENYAREVYEELLAKS